jgi:hypothetical protein
MLLAILLPVQAMMGEQQDHGRFPGQKGDKEDATRVRFIRPQLTAVNDAFALAQGKTEAPVNEQVHFSPR